jgi:hypothetical protein
MLTIYSVEVQLNLQIGEVVSTIPSEYVIIGFGGFGDSQGTTQQLALM